IIKNKDMKKIKNIILGLVCSAGLFAATMTATAPATKAAEQKQDEQQVCAIVVVSACEQAGMGIICRDGSLSADLIRKFAYAIADDLCSY
ncbi:MAG: hypothetical protein LBH30_07725, partial [Prevotellaceae bacterium]|nr:hypothetical protein [Prevotellaceae bacterium]